MFPSCYKVTMLQLLSIPSVPSVLGAISIPCQLNWSRYRPKNLKTMETLKSLEISSRSFTGRRKAAHLLEEQVNNSLAFVPLQVQSNWPHTAKAIIALCLRSLRSLLPRNNHAVSRIPVATPNWSNLCFKPDVIGQPAPVQPTH